MTLSKITLFSSAYVTIVCVLYVSTKVKVDIVRFKQNKHKQSMCMYCFFFSNFTHIKWVEVYTERLENRKKSAVYI
jgi:hypothetical protein